MVQNLEKLDPICAKKPHITLLQLIKGISSDPKELDKCFSGTTIFVFFNDLSLPSASGAFPKRLSLYLKDVELSKATFKGFSAFHWRFICFKLI